MGTEGEAVVSPVLARIKVNAHICVFVCVCLYTASQMPSLWIVGRSVAGCQKALHYRGF